MNRQDNSSFSHRRVGTLALLIIALSFALAGRSFADQDRCAICNEVLSGTVYVVTDKVTGEKKQVCSQCSTLPQTCFICGLPVKKDFTSLPDGRFLCARDAKRAVLDEDEARHVYADVKEELDKLFSRFLSFPTTNVEAVIVDRVNLLELFKFPGEDYVCPNVLGYIQSKTNEGRIHHTISLLGALPRAEFKAVCAHELSHAWVFENASERRKKILGHDAHEGFCELVAYLFLDSQGEEDQKRALLRNAYTRGQIDLFVTAEKRFGFNEVIEWMKYGTDAVLHGDDLNRIRNVEIPSVKPGPRENPPAARAEPGPAPDVLTVKAISWHPERPWAIVNGRSFRVQEEGKVRIGTTNVTIRCLEIRTNSVIIQVKGSNAKQELYLAE